MKSLMITAFVVLLSVSGCSPSAAPCPQLPEHVAEPAAPAAVAGDQAPETHEESASTTVGPGDAPPAAPLSDVLPGWILAGKSPSLYRVTRDADVHLSGSASARLEAVDHPEKTFGTLMQRAAADAMRGKRVRFKANVRNDDVAEWAGLWMRIDRKGGQIGAFDNMQHRPIVGTGEWQEYSVVLDVATDAETINYGILLAGSGVVWMDDASIDIVDASVPVTGSNSGTSTLSRPTNLDFEAVR